MKQRKGEQESRPLGPELPAKMAPVHTLAIEAAVIKKIVHHVALNREYERTSQAGSGNHIGIIRFAGQHIRTGANHQRKC